LVKKSQKLFAFVIMPFESSYDDIYKLGIKEAAKECEIMAERLDEQLFSEGMIDRIYRQIEKADIIIADLSDRNENVFYELGFAHAKDKLCLLLTNDAEDIPFDLKHRRHIAYGQSISYLKEELIKNINWAKSEIKNQSKTRIRVQIGTPSGNLSTTTHTANCSINFTFDLYNDTNRISSEITAIYLYAGKKWDLSQDGKDCSFTDSDIPPFKYRYFLTPPITRLGKESWAQIKCNGTRILARSWKGEEIKQEYTIGGRGILRIVTEEGSFDHEFDFSIGVNVVPF